MISDLYNEPFSRSSLKCLVCLFTVFPPFSFRIQYVRLSLKVVVQFRLSAILIHNKTCFIRSEVLTSVACGSSIRLYHFTCWNIHSFIHSIIILLVCLSTGPEPFQNQALQRLRADVSSFKFQYRISSLKAFSSCLRCLPRLFVLSIFPSVTCFEGSSTRYAC